MIDMNDFSKNNRLLSLFIIIGCYLCLSLHVV